ncbi:MAG: hypothetical protein K8S98_12725 [Planctomycetes bacterium]|nr:hypothetical protein [Planctomycetota bacterium]
MNSGVVLLALCAALVPVDRGGDRPSDPWVFRGAWNGHERVLVARLAGDLGVIYDLEHASMLTAFAGDVRDGEHGFEIDAARYTDGPEGAVWWIEEGGSAKLADARFKGHRLQNGQVTLRYELVTESGARIQIEETPEFETPESFDADPSSVAPWLVPGLIGLRRSFKATGIPPGVRVALLVRARCVGYVDYDRILPEGEREIEVGGKTLRELYARLLIEPDNGTHEIHFFFEPGQEAK